MGVPPRLALRPLAALLAGGIALAALPRSAGAEPSHAHKPPPAAERRSTGMMIAGIVLTGVGAAAVVGGGVVMGAGEGEGVGLGTAILAPGAAALLTGIPLWIVGAIPPAPERPRMKLAGILLTSLGAAAVVGGVGAFAAGVVSQRSGAFVAAYSLFPTGVLATEVGVPLWVVGAGSGPAGQPAASVRLLPNGVGVSF